MCCCVCSIELELARFAQSSVVSVYNKTTVIELRVGTDILMYVSHSQ